MFNRRHIMGMMAGGLAYGLCPKVSAESFVQTAEIYAEGVGPIGCIHPQPDSPISIWNQGLEHWGFPLADHGNRPAVQQFFRRWTDRIAVINGISTRR